MDENAISRIVVNEALKIHRELGPGLLESVYEVVLAQALTQQGLQVERQVKVPIQYNGISFDEGFRADILINKKVVLELKSVEQVNKVHHKQLLTYIRLMKVNLGLLINFNSPLIKDGIHRVVNQLAA
ncbi:GxxExxY protein [Cerasicoccus maritimus]|uniref:GxxExxY protein n=1 Tax=Cerasicoccus maritimus TaxID=490089 RepID=UPI002852D81D|nr:GxxExxY protein [Cerasicoccus maritimus]